MKKLLALLLVLVTFLTSSGFLSFFTRGVTDPVLIPEEGVSLPQGRNVALGGGYVYNYAPATYSHTVMNLANGRATEITLRAEDTEAWMARIRESYEENDPAKSFDEYLQLLELMGQSLPVITPEFRVLNARGRYAECHTGSFSAILDRETARLLPSPEVDGVVGLTYSGQVLARSSDGDATVLSLYGLDGTLSRTASFDFSAYPYKSFAILENGVLATLYGNYDADFNASCTLVFIDRELRAGTPIELGTIRFLANFAARDCKGTGKIILTSPMLRETLLIDPADGSCTMLMIDGNGAAIRPYEEGALSSGTGVTTVIGFQQDGSYALLTSLRGGLYKLDMNDLTLTQQMTTDELTAIGLSPVDASTLAWDGGEYAVSYNRVFRIENK